LEALGQQEASLQSRRANLEAETHAADFTSLIEDADAAPRLSELKQISRTGRWWLGTHSP
jgi:hypothetical protein